MLSTLSDLAALNISPTESAMGYVDEETTCFVCGAPPMPRSPGAIVEWCRQFSPGDYAVACEALENGYPAQASRELGGGRATADEKWLDRIRQLMHDTKLEIVTLLSFEQLERLLEHQDFIEEALPIVACGQCTPNYYGWFQLPDLLTRGMVRRYGDGNEKAAFAQPIWNEFEKLLSAIRLIARGEASSG